MMVWKKINFSDKTARPGAVKPQPCFFISLTGIKVHAQARRSRYRHCSQGDIRGFSPSCPVAPVAQRQCDTVLHIQPVQRCTAALKILLKRSHICVPSPGNIHAELQIAQRMARLLYEFLFAVPVCCNAPQLVHGCLRPIHLARRQKAGSFVAGHKTRHLQRLSPVAAHLPAPPVPSAADRRRDIRWQYAPAWCSGLEASIPFFPQGQQCLQESRRVECFIQQQKAFLILPRGHEPGYIQCDIHSDKGGQQRDDCPVEERGRTARHIQPGRNACRCAQNSAARPGDTPAFRKCIDHVFLLCINTAAAVYVHTQANAPRTPLPAATARRKNSARRRPDIPAAALLQPPFFRPCRQSSGAAPATLAFLCHQADHRQHSQHRKCYDTAQSVGGGEVFEALLCIKAIQGSEDPKASCYSHASPPWNPHQWPERPPRAHAQHGNQCCHKASGRHGVSRHGTQTVIKMAASRNGTRIAGKLVAAIALPMGLDRLILAQDYHPWRHP